MVHRRDIMQELRLAVDKFEMSNMNMNNSSH